MIGHWGVGWSRHLSGGHHVGGIWIAQSQLGVRDALLIIKKLYELALTHLRTCIRLWHRVCCRDSDGCSS